MSSSPESSHEKAKSPATEYFEHNQKLKDAALALLQHREDKSEFNIDYDPLIYSLLRIFKKIINQPKKSFRVDEFIHSMAQHYKVNKKLIG